MSSLLFLRLQRDPSSGLTPANNPRWKEYIWGASELGGSKRIRSEVP